MDASKASTKRLIVCCDGTWMNALGKDGDTPQTNVVRITRCIKTTAQDGADQVTYYHAGIGSSGSPIDYVTGGDFGIGLDSNIRIVYNFVCSNYEDGDDIILIGFSRGAFTARSVADMIASIGLMTIFGLDRFYDIFQDYEHLGDKKREVSEYLCPNLTPYNGEEGREFMFWEDERKRIFREWLRDEGYARFCSEDGTRQITVKAVGVWDTVGDLGIPPIPVLGIVGSAKHFTNNHVSARIENAFQALALDEPRASFKPALWERIHGNQTNLKQVWFPGTHANVGGGFHDQQISIISLAWMCDQLSTVGVEFDFDSMTKVFMESLLYSAAHPFPWVPVTTTERLLHPGGIKPRPWANADLFPACESALPRDAAEPAREYHAGPADLAIDDTEDGLRRLRGRLWETARPWALGQTRRPTSALQAALGSLVRRPGLFARVDEETNRDTGAPLLDAGERVHASARVRLAAAGLDLDDAAVWACAPLTAAPAGPETPLWRLERGSAFDPADDEARAAGAALLDDDPRLYPVRPDDSHWRWVYAQPVAGEGDWQVPQATVLPEEPLVGFWERYLLALLAGSHDIWRYAQEHPPLSM